MSTDTTTQRPPTRAAEPSSDVVAAGGRGLLAVLVDGLLALAPLLVVPVLAHTRLPLGWAWAIALVAVVALGFAMVLDVRRTGRSPGRRLLGVRTVSAATLLPPSPRDLLQRTVIDADLHAGRDPLWLVPTLAPPLLPASWDGWQPSAPIPSGDWGLVLDNGQQLAVARASLIGRAPTNEAGQDYALIAIPDLTRSISRVHAILEPGEDCLWLTDGGATNGTRAASPSPSGGTVIERWLRPGERIALRSGGLIHLGDRALRITRSAHPGA